MPLAKSCEEFIGKTLWVAPTPEWTEYLVTSSNPIQIPNRFSFSLEELLLWGENYVGCIGQISGKSPFTNQYIGVLARATNIALDFTREIHGYNIIVGPQRPKMTGLQAPPHPESIEIEGRPIFMGYGDVSCNPNHSFLRRVR